MSENSYFIGRKLNRKVPSLIRMQGKSRRQIWNEWLIGSFLPRPLISFFAHPYIGGYTLDQVMAVVQRLYHQQHLLSTIDILGEEVPDMETAIQNKALYLKLLDTIYTQFEATLTEHTTLSLKLSSLTQVEAIEPQIDLDERLLESNLTAILDRAQQLSIGVTLDMEDHHWTTFTLATYQHYLKQGYQKLGTVLQSCLHRTEADMEALNSQARIRLCIGIYREPADIALTDKAHMKERLLTLGKKLLSKGVYTEFATHDEIVIKRLVDEVLVPGAYPNQPFEFQMLLGVPRDPLQQQLVKGHFRPHFNPVPIRLYVPFAPNKREALSYCKRRLIANPAMITYGLQNLWRKML